MDLTTHRVVIGNRANGEANVLAAVVQLFVQPSTLLTRWRKLRQDRPYGLSTGILEQSVVQPDILEVHTGAIFIDLINTVDEFCLGHAWQEFGMTVLTTQNATFHFAFERRRTIKEVEHSTLSRVEHLCRVLDVQTTDDLFVVTLTVRSKDALLA